MSAMGVRQHSGESDERRQRNPRRHFLEVASTSLSPLSSPPPALYGRRVHVRRFLLAACFIISVISSMSSLAAAQSMQLFVDLSDAPRNIYHSRLTIPVKPGPFTLVYPKWIPGNHRPSGPIANVTGIRMEAGGQTLVWQRDPIDMYAFHVDVPAGTNELRVSLDTITNDGSAGAS